MPLIHLLRVPVFTTEVFTAFAALYDFGGATALGMYRVGKAHNAKKSNEAMASMTVYPVHSVVTASA